MERRNFIKTILAGGAGSLILPAKYIVEDSSEIEMHPLNPTPAIKVLLEQYKAYEGLQNTKKEEVAWFEENIDSVQIVLDKMLSMSGPEVEEDGYPVNILAECFKTYPNRHPFVEVVGYSPINLLILSIGTRLWYVRPTIINSIMYPVTI